MSAERDVVAERDAAAAPVNVADALQNLAHSIDCLTFAVIHMARTIGDPNRGSSP